MKCLAPWHSILVRFNGDIVPDGVYKARYGNVLKSSLNDVLNSYTAHLSSDDFAIHSVEDLLNIDMFKMLCSKFKLEFNQDAYNKVCKFIDENKNNNR